jgi:hypothetical protein
VAAQEMVLSKASCWLSPVTQRSFSLEDSAGVSLISLWGGLWGRTRCPLAVWQNGLYSVCWGSSTLLPNGDLAKSQERALRGPAFGRILVARAQGKF